MSWTRILFLGGLLTAASPSWAVSKVGGGTLSNDDAGFRSKVPPDYERYHILPSQDVRMDASPVIRGNSVQQRFILAYLLANEQPQWVGKTDRTEFRDFYRGFGWRDMGHAESCVEHWVKVSGGMITRLLSWGDGRGAIFTSTPGQEWDLEYMAHSLRLDPGVCSWR